MNSRVLGPGGKLTGVIHRVEDGTSPARRLEEYDHVSFLMSGLGIPVGLGDLIQRIASIYHCP
jgi:hypothetical protein